MTQLLSSTLSSALLPEAERSAPPAAPPPVSDGPTPSSSPSRVSDADLAHEGVHFLEQEERARWSAEGMLVVRVERIGAAARGRLGEIIDEAVERELAARGAPSPGIGAGDALSDQLFRARQVGSHRIGLALGSLRAAISPTGALEASDAAALIFWSRASRERPVALALDMADASLPAHVTPIPLSLALLPQPTTPAAPPAARTRPVEPLTAAPPTTLSPAPALSPAPSIAPAPAPALSPAPAPAPSLARPRAPLPRPTLPAIDDATWRTWTLALTAARGPQPLTAFERLFTQSYLPLSNAIAAGLDDPRARTARDEFRRNFGRVFTEACPTFAVTGKRPRMVFDAPDVAARIARLHGARTTQLLLVDGMRYDLGALVRDKLAGALGSRGSLTDEALLWSALPTTTARQLYLLGHGSEGLREEPPSEREPEPMRGRTVETIRRVKIGSRDVYKLDLPEVRLREATVHALDALPGIAATVADVIARHAATLAARTLLFVFGDHGFTVEADGTTRHGGPSPEEVLVPGYAFLIADVH